MKVLFISSWYPNSVNPLKGIYVKKHAAAIKQAGIEIQVLAITVSPSNKFFEKRTDKSVDEFGITTHSIELNSRFHKFIHLDLFLQFSFLKNYFFNSIKPTFKPDIIHSNVLYPSAIMGHRLANQEKLPHVITEHWSKVDKFMSKSLYASAGKKAYASAKGITVVSEFLKKSISKHVTYYDKISVVPNVINTEVFSFKTKEISKEELIFTCVAHWTNPKRPDLIFKSLENISKRNGKKIVLNVVGEGVLLNELKSSNWNFTVNYLGNLQPDKLAKILHTSNYFLHASSIETFSIVIAEALATGTPVLASNVGAISELVNKENGLVCENNIDDWSKCLYELVTRSDFDYKKISETSNKYSLAQIGKEFKSLYDSVL